MCFPAIAAALPSLSTITASLPSLSAITAAAPSLGTVFAGAGALTSAFGAVRQSQFQSANMQYQSQLAAQNAQIAENNAVVAQQAAIADADTIDRQRRIALAQQSAQRAAQGVVINEGSTLDTLGDAAAELELDRLNRLYEGGTRARAQLAQAGQDTAASRGLLVQASQARTSGTIGALTSLAKGGYQISRSMSRTPSGLRGYAIPSSVLATMPKGTSGLTSRQYAASYPANAF
tara:strand:+ start:184 stop:885 length:702 start_codon:yes stop_codon:yes gene_type:complete